MHLVYISFVNVELLKHSWIQNSVLAWPQSELLFTETELHFCDTTRTSWLWKWKQQILLGGGK